MLNSVVHASLSGLDFDSTSVLSRNSKLLCHFSHKVLNGFWMEFGIYIMLRHVGLVNHNFALCDLTLKNDAPNTVIL